ncbi:quinolinate synthase NadA [Methanobrevibacter sp. DSM 116169]|uniref:quinolinate synthase NadA n=1 Tax=Methanobrevibacter sp. DSM 116169 TaxID=3242727 RepID=UPI0038FD14A1
MNNNIKNEINDLKKEKNAIILAHNYQPKEVQEIADFLGDSLELCIKASQLDDKDIIIFCGVDFMGETAFILNPDKKIIIPDLDADCPMAHMTTGEEVKVAKKKHPDAAVCLYVNSLADAKQYADTLCTSSNVVKVIESLDEDEILFGPDNNLGEYVSSKTFKKIIPITDEGYCYVHKKFTVQDIETKRKEHPDVEVICHPECDKVVQDKCDKVMSTGGMINYILDSDKNDFVLGTEIDIASRINLLNPDKNIIPLRDDAICDSMKIITLEKIRDSLKNEEPLIKLPDEIAKKSLKAVNHMLDASKN